MLTTPPRFGGSNHSPARALFFPGEVRHERESGTISKTMRSARPYRDPSIDYASDARDERESPTVPFKQPLYTPYRHGSHCWAFDAAIGRSSGFDDRTLAQRAADKQKAEDEAECLDASKVGMIAWTLRKALNLYPPGMSAADNPYVETSSETAVV